LLSCERGTDNHPDSCLIDAFNIIYYTFKEGNHDAFTKTFTWVLYDLSIHAEDCAFDNETEISDIILNLNESLGLPPQFALYNIPMIYYVK